MSLSTLINKILDTEKFKNEYTKLLKKSVRSQIPNIIYDKQNDETIDWSYLISCASIFAKSEEGKPLDIAYRICQTVICENGLPNEYKNAAAAVFDLSANSSAVILAKNRNLIDGEYTYTVPMGTLMDIMQKHFENTIIDGDNITILNEFQKEVYSSFDENQVVAISAPTSTGKSFILLHLLADYIRANPKANVIYIVPTRALIQQVELDIKEHLKSRLIVAETTSVPVLPQLFNKISCVFVFTQERLQWIISEHPEIEFDLVIVDEAHKIGDSSRGVLLQQVLQQISHEKGTKFIFASPMSENPGELFKAVKASGNKKAITSEIVTVNQNLLWVSKLDTRTTNWSVDLLSHGQKINLGKLECERITKESMRLPILAYRIATGQSGNLLYVNGAADAEKVAIQLKSMVLNDNPNYKPSNRVNDLISLITKTIHPDYALIDALKGGIAFHYGNMPLVIRNEIEDLFKTGEISFLVCTSTLIEGVNLPAKSIFVRGPKRGAGVPMNEMDFWNLAGRAGRQGKEFQGNIYCLDAGDTRVWTNETPVSRKKYLIKSTIDRIVESNSSELIDYINSGNFITRNNEMDYAYTYFLDAYYKYGNLENTYMCQLYGKDFCHRIDDALNRAISQIEIPKEILLKNQGVNPLAQQRLYDYFKEFNREIGELIPPNPEEDDAQERYMHIIGRISSHLTGDTPRLNSYRSILITNWLRGHGLARIISENINWHKEHKRNENVATIIRNTMRDIEEYARFKFLKYTACYIDVLKLYLNSKGEGSSIEKIPPLNLWLEFGASKRTQISLMAMGFTRTAALEFSDLIVDENYNEEQCLRWLLSTNINGLDLPVSLVEEAHRIISLRLV